MSWFVYILRCSDGTLYTGVTKNLKRRLKEHNGEEDGGAKYTRARRPVTLVYSEPCKDRSTAGKREVAIKHMNIEEKRALIEK